MSAYPYRVLVVCTGNICRSPMGAVVLRARLEETGIDGKVQVDSAGISAEEQGNSLDSRARLVLTEAGYNPGIHRARQVQPSDLVKYDLILAMTRGHLQSLRRLSGINEERNSVIGTSSDTQSWEQNEHIARNLAVHGREQKLASDLPPTRFTEGLGSSEEHKLRSGAKLYLWNEFDSAAVDPDVPDPWYGSRDGFWDTLASVERGADGLIPYIRAQVSR